MKLTKQQSAHLDECALAIRHAHKQQESMSRAFMRVISDYRTLDRKLQAVIELGKRIPENEFDSLKAAVQGTINSRLAKIGKEQGFKISVSCGEFAESVVENRQSAGYCYHVLFATGKGKRRKLAVIGYRKALISADKGPENGTKGASDPADKETKEAHQLAAQEAQPEDMARALGEILAHMPAKKQAQVIGALFDAMGQDHIRATTKKALAAIASA